MLKYDLIRFKGQDWFVGYEYTPASGPGGEPEIGLCTLSIRTERVSILELLRPEVVEQIEAQIAKSYNTPGSIT
jgi:hypothetical protein